ncbi:uncharacterized protein PV09_08913 [Verruconis gallopava]|uniref:Uncharacterized protein n=1 Tax=Verruconis gallopava TaxID=253628 RepID=A0A0D2AK71_9PEZI|nr:uncharacterized protein PV09_08913 [Verruconis gallopava]KIV99368.1 hypothetical protein PV09_08913 [Verruconis gallopava]
MPARIARSSLSAPAAKAPRKKRSKFAKRSLNAFAIAEAEDPEKPKIRRNRLGHVEDDGPRIKRRRMSGNDDDDEGNLAEEPSAKRRARSGESSASEESDEEGHRWKVGIVDEDDDSDIDSEEAFGESDEEKFEGWTFRGGSGAVNKASKRKPHLKRDEETNEMNLEEEEEEEEAEKESDDESLGSDAVDLATMLDNYEPSGDEESGSESNDEAEHNSGEGYDDTAPSDYSMSDAEDEDQADKAARLQNLVSSLHPTAKTTKKAREIDAHESRTPSTAGLVASEKFDINDFLATTSDPSVKQVSKELGVLPKASSSSKKSLKLEPSLPKRQRDRLDRIAANEKAKETLERWVDTVKHQRQAEHLSFPLMDANEGKSSKFSLAVTQPSQKPFNDLEATIQSIMVESGLSSGKKDEEEEKLREFEELGVNKLPLEEVQARRAELRKARELLFREEVRAKRIKKIKSKAFRRIKRKEKERLAAIDRDAFAEGGGIELDEEEREMAERRRAEERMRLKHKDSKWAKQMKKSGRTIWDDEAISGVVEMARKSDELRRRIEGREVRDEDASGDDLFSSSEDDEDAVDGDDDAAEFRRLQRQMQRAEEDEHVDEKASKLYGLKFMRDAEARRKKENLEALRQIKKELNGDAEATDSEEEEANIGRKIFAPNGHAQSKASGAKREIRGEFEEKESEGEDEVEIVTDKPIAEANGTVSHALTAQSSKGTEETRPTSEAKPSARGGKSRADRGDTGIELLPREKHSQPDSDGWITVTYNDSDNETNSAEAEDGNASMDQTEILRRAFAGDDVEDAFEDEKNADIEEDAPKVVDTTLPGWGSWVGAGLSKREKQQQKRPPHANQLKKIEGIERSKRRDAKLKGVVINEKRNKANAQYLASELPHVYGSKQEYERSIRMPVGEKWNTTVTFRENIKPRVLIKPGAVIRPMEKPLI